MVQIRFKRGLKEDIPNLAEGEPGFCTDTKEFFMGSDQGNINFKNIINVKDFGAIGDGINDDTESIKKAFSYITSDRKHIFFPVGKYYITERIQNILSENDYLKVSGDNAELYAKDNLTDDSILSFTQSVKNENIEIIEDIPENTDTIIINDTSIIKTGDIIRINTDEVFTYRENYGQIHYKSFVTKVLEIIDSNTLRLTDSIPYAFSSNNDLTIDHYGKPANITVQNLSFSMEHKETDKNITGLRLNSIFKGTIKNIKTNYFSMAGVSLRHTYNININNINCEGSHFSNDLNYGVVLFNSYHINIENSNISAKRHSIACSGSPCYWVRINNCSLYSDIYYSFNSHVCGEVFLNNCYLSSGVQMGEGKIHLNNCELQNRTDYQFVIRVRPDYKKSFSLLNINNCIINTKKYNSNPLSFIYITGIYNTSDDETISLDQIGNINIKNCIFKGSEIEAILRINSILDTIQTIGNFSITNNLFLSGGNIITIDGDLDNHTESEEKGSINFSNNKTEKFNISLNNTISKLFSNVSIINNEPLKIINPENNQYDYNDFYYFINNYVGFLKINNNIFTNGGLIENSDRVILIGNHYLSSNINNYLVRVRKNNFLQLVDNIIYQKDTDINVQKGFQNTDNSFLIQNGNVYLEEPEKTYSEE
ncbi:MAG: glycosyl hydrolase family 28-related protein [archaeon]